MKQPKLWFTVIIYILSTTARRDYFNLHKSLASLDHAEQICNERGYYLASIHSISENIELTDSCRQCETCWIGLEITFGDENITTYKWFDNTNIDETFMHKNLCDGYENNLYVARDISYYTYIDSNLSCWNITINSSLEMCYICGPKMFDPTYAWYWILDITIPAITALFGAIYALYVFRYLFYHLYQFEHNYIVYPTIAIIRTAIILPVLLSIIFLCGFTYFVIFCIGYNKTGIMAPSNLINKDYPSIYISSGGLIIIGVLLYIPVMAISYTHILLQLKNSFDNNQFMRDAIFSKCKCFYPLMSVLIILYTSVPVVFFFVNFEGKYLYDLQDPIKIILILLWTILDILINLILLCSYIKGLHTFSIEQYFRSDDTKEKIINDRQHELMLEATRYTVLFGIVSIVDIVLCCVGLLIMIVKDKGIESDIERLMMYLTILMKEIVLLTAIQLSFKFSHIKYEKICKYCDIRMKIYCHKIAKEQNENTMKKRHKIIQEQDQNNLKERLLPNNGELEM